MTHDPSNPDDVKQRRASDAVRRKQAETDLEWVLSDPRGRRVLASVVEQCGVNRLSFVAGDPLATAFNEGRRSVGIFLTNALTAP